MLCAERADLFREPTWRTPPASACPPSPVPLDERPRLPLLRSGRTKSTSCLYLALRARPLAVRLVRDHVAVLQVGRREEDEGIARHHDRATVIEVCHHPAFRPNWFGEADMHVRVTFFGDMWGAVRERHEVCH